MKAQSEIMVKKFGGTSMGSPERILWVAERLLQDQMNGQKPVVVASAMSGETDRLVKLGREINSGDRGMGYDMLVATGEQAAIALLAMAIERKGGKARPYIAPQVRILTNKMHSRARIQEIETQNIRRDASQGIIPIIAGFQGITSDGELTTLGRGGSDTSAVAVAVALGLRDCEIYTDVPAVYSADPRLVSKAREIHMLSFEDMMEMASVGSKILHIRSVQLGAKYNVRIHVRSTFETRDGTWIVPEAEMMENPLVSAVTHESNTTVVRVLGVSQEVQDSASLFEALAAKGIVVDMISPIFESSKSGIAFSIPTDEQEPTIQILKDVMPKAEVLTTDRVAKISIVGVGMKSQPGVAARFFRIFSDQKIPIHFLTTSEIRVSAIIDKERLSSAAQALHDGFIKEPLRV